MKKLLLIALLALAGCAKAEPQKKVNEVEEKIIEEEPVQKEEQTVPVVPEEVENQIEEPLLDFSEGIENTEYKIISPEGGVYFYDGRTETYYSSNVLYHYNTPNWSVDDQGFYRDSNGYYVVAASDMPQGTVFACSMGDCVVEDSGCAPGVTDYYVAW